MDYTKFDEYIGKELYQARVKKKLTQDKITKLINYELITTFNWSKKPIARQSYVQYELGQRSMPETIFRATCNVLNLNASEVFEKANDKFKQYYLNQSKEVRTNE